MSDPIYGIIERLALIEGKTTPVNVKHGLNKQQQGVPQLPALFRPKNISPTLSKKPYQAHPADGYMVGEQRSSLEEAMQAVEEEMLSKVKGQFADYLERLEKENELDHALVKKVKKELDIINDPADEMKEQATWDSDVAPPSDPGDSEVAHGVEDHIAAAVAAPAAPMSAVSESPAKIYTLEDGACLECYGDDERGYEVKHAGRSLPTRFPRLDHADMAVKLFQKRRRAAQQEQDQDYIEEK